MQTEPNAVVALAQLRFSFVLVGLAIWAWVRLTDKYSLDDISDNFKNCVFGRYFLQLLGPWHMLLQLCGRFILGNPRNGLVQSRANL